ncbi:hypothetical protein [Candidatus Poriferisocius sp.]|uniref:hypothetical protein n=1 Tax=Candidatus Poriferisocius sp. TaxID=3101276 RepID=UPI003B021CE9
MDMEQLADACGGLAWISERLFEVEGHLAAGSAGSAEGSPLDARSRVLLARSSRRYGQHAQWWRAALPDSPALAGPDRIHPPTRAWARLLNLIEESVPTEAVAALHEVALPQLMLALERVMGQLSPVSDGAVMRIARMVSADLMEERSEGQATGLAALSPSSSALEHLVVEFALEHQEKRWPPLVTHP